MLMSKRMSKTNTLALGLFLEVEDAGEIIWKVIDRRWSASFHCLEGK